MDAARFQRLLREGEEALARGAPRRAQERLSEAIALWRGRPFGELADEGTLRREAERLEELRLRAVEGRVEAELELGKSGELVDELEALAGEHPYRERLWRQLMLALYRAGRQAEALAAYRRARTILDEELGLEPGEELRRLEQAILRQEVPEVVPPEERHNLPAPLTSFVGRERELQEVERLLQGARLLTLTGVGGSGKTRLALEAARRALPDFPDGVYFCDLSALADPALVWRQLATVLDVREQPERELDDLLVARLRDGVLLLVLDNCEHLRQACAELAQRLLQATPKLGIFATSREPLGAPGEVDYPLPPLSLPRADSSPDEIRSSEAVRLFLDRALSARPGLADDERSLTTVAGICSDLEGLPLALELAAARAKALSLEEIADRLADRFQFLVSWRRLVPARHRTLEEAMDWSYELLTDEERALLARLSAFAGGFTLAAAAAVCLGGDEERALALVERLVDASLVVAEERDGEMRYRLLETVRQYAAKRLLEDGKTAATQRRHADYFGALADTEYSTLERERDVWVECMQREHDNLRAALAWSRDARADDDLLHLVANIWQFWWIRGELGEGSAWLDVALERSAEVSPRLRAQILEGAAGLAWAQGEFDRAGELAEAGRSLFTEVGDARGQLACVTVLGLVALAREDLVAAEAFFQRTRELAESLGDEFRKDVHAALAFHNLASVALTAGDLDSAAERYETALALYRAEGDRYGVALSELYLGTVCIEAGRHEEAAAYLGRALAVFREMAFVQYTTQCLEGIAAVVQSRGDPADAVRLLGAADALHERTGNPPYLPIRDRVAAAARADLGDSAFATAWADGRALPEHEALDRAQRAIAS